MYSFRDIIFDATVIYYLDIVFFWNFLRLFGSIVISFNAVSKTIGVPRIEFV